MFATIYTDASGGQGSFGYAYYTKCDQGVYSGSGAADCFDINHAEMYCIVKAIQESIKKFKNISRILVVTDSTSAQYTLWQGSNNSKYFQVINDFRLLERKVEKIMIKWTKGHRRDDSDRAYLNNKCDERAKKARKKCV